MGIPITWQNVTGASPADAARPLFLAQNAINSGFDGLSKMIADRQAIETSNWDNQKVNNTQAFLNQLAQYRTPEALAAAQQSGELDRLRTSFGAQVDQAAVRGAQDTRLDTLYKQSQTATDYNKAQQVLAHAPIMEQAKVLAAKGDIKGLDALKALYPAMPGLGEVTAAGIKSKQDADQFDQRIKNEKAQILVAQQNAGTASRNADVNARQQTVSEIKLIGDEGKDLTTRLTALDAKSASSSDGLKALQEAAMKIEPNDADQRAALTRNIGDFLAKPENKHITVGEALAAMQAAERKSWFQLDNSRGTDIPAYFENLVNSPEYQARGLATQAAKDNLIKQSREIQQFFSPTKK